MTVTSMLDNVLRIATRQSPLALWQAHYVNQRLEACHPGLSVELVPMVTRGDVILDTPLAKVGGKGLFVKEQFQKQGIGEALIQRVKDEKKILTLTVYENNQAALLFYERQGFRRVRCQIDPETQQREWLMRWTRDEKLQKGSRKKIDFNN